MKNLVFLVLILTVACSKYSNQYLEIKTVANKGEEEKLNFQYFSNVIENPEDMFNVDQNFRKSTINSKDRANFSKYAKIFFDASLRPFRVENYVQDPYNSHIYFPYLIIMMQEENDKYIMNITPQKIENGIVKADTTVMKVFKKKGEGNFDDFMKAIAADPGNTEFVNVQFKFNFIPAVSDKNKRVSNSLGAITENVVYLEGSHPVHKNKNLHLYFFEQNRSSAPDFKLGEEIPVIATLSKVLPDEISFIFVNVDEERLKAMGKTFGTQSKEMNNMEGIYSNKKEK